jgi:hypothetical protein
MAIYIYITQTTVDFLMRLWSNSQERGLQVVFNRRSAHSQNGTSRFTEAHLGTGKKPEFHRNAVYNIYIHTATAR